VIKYCEQRNEGEMKMIEIVVKSGNNDDVPGYSQKTRLNLLRRSIALLEDPFESWLSLGNTSNLKLAK